MRGLEHGSKSLFSYVALEERVPKKHPLRTLKGVLDEVLQLLDG